MRHAITANPERHESACCKHTKLNPTGRKGQPFHDGGRVGAIFREPVPALIMLGRQIDQDGHGVTQSDIIVNQNRHFTARIDGQKRGLVLLVGHEIDNNGFIFKAEKGQQESDLMAIAGFRVLVQFHTFLL